MSNKTFCLQLKRLSGYHSNCCSSLSKLANIDFKINQSLKSNFKLARKHIIKLLFEVQHNKLLFWLKWDYEWDAQRYV